MKGGGKKEKGGERCAKSGEDGGGTTPAHFFI